MKATQKVKKMDMKSHHRIIIVGTIPYNKNTSSRAFDAYFHNWEKENLRQIFSNTKTPIKGHCGSLYQITDQRLVKCWVHKICDPGLIYSYQDLPDDWKDNNLEVNSRLIDLLYRFGSNDSPLKYLLRKVLWNKKFWNTTKLKDWLEEFKPECVFLAFSDDFFIPEIALSIATRYDIPIMSCIGDDYYFNEKKSLSPFYHIYRSKYKHLIRKVFEHRGSAIYIGNKIRDKYNQEFGLNGETVYLTSDIERRQFRVIDKKFPRFSYCGNIRLGRNNSLADIGKALYTINPAFKLDVYSAEGNKEYIDVLKSCEGINFHGAVSYQEVMNITSQSDVVVIVEGFDKEDVDITRYSLSTKAADAITSGCQILAYGDVECGVISYLYSLGCAMVCNSKNTLEDQIRQLLKDEELQRHLYTQSDKIAKENHDKLRNLSLSERLFNNLIEREGGQ